MKIDKKEYDEKDLRKIVIFLMSVQEILFSYTVEDFGENIGLSNFKFRADQDRVYLKKSDVRELLEFIKIHMAKRELEKANKRKS